MSASIMYKIANYLRLPKLTPQERADFETLRQAIIRNPDKLSEICRPPYTVVGIPQQTYMLESDIKLFINYYIRPTTTPSYIYPPNIPVKNHFLSAYVAWPDGGFTDLSATKRAYLLLKTIQHATKKHCMQKYGSPANYEREFIAKYGAHAR